MAHEMRGILLVILLFMLLDKYKKSLLQSVGDETLSQFIHLFKLMIMFKCWLDCDEFSREELEMASKFIPILIQTLVNNVKRKNMTLPKIHWMHHFIEQVYNFGSASNISGRIHETNLKEKVKRPSKTMRMESHNIEYQTAVKVTEWCLIHKAACELVDSSNTNLSKYVSGFKTIDSDDNQGHNILAIRWWLKKIGTLSYSNY